MKWTMAASLLALVLSQRLYAQTGPCTAAAVLRVDSAWVHSFATHNVDSVMAFYDPRAVFSGSAMARGVKGAAALRAFWTSWLADSTRHLSGKSTSADVLDGCEAAFSTGRWRIQTPKSDTSGPYMAVWRKSRSGTWRVLIDAAWY